MGIFRPFGIPSTASFVESSSFSYEVDGANVTGSDYSLVAISGASGSTGTNAPGHPNPDDVCANVDLGDGIVWANAVPNLTPTVSRNYYLCYPNPSISLTPTPTRTPTRTKTISQTRTATISQTPTKTKTPTRTKTISLTPTPTRTAGVSQTPTRTKTISLTPTKTRTATISQTPTRTATISQTPTKTKTPTRTKTISLTPTKTKTPTRTKTISLTPTKTSTKTLTPTVSQAAGAVASDTSLTDLCTGLAGGTRYMNPSCYSIMAAGGDASGCVAYNDAALTTPWTGTGTAYLQAATDTSKYYVYNRTVPEITSTSAQICPSPTPTPTKTISLTPTKTRTRTISQTPTKTRTATISQTPTKTRTATISQTRTRTRTISQTPTRTRTRTISQTPTRTRTRTISQTPTRTRTRTISQTPTKTRTRSATVSLTPTRTKTISQTATQTQGTVFYSTSLNTICRSGGSAKTTTYACAQSLVNGCSINSVTSTGYARDANAESPENYVNVNSSGTVTSNEIKCCFQVTNANDFCDEPHDPSGCFSGTGNTGAWYSNCTSYSNFTGQTGCEVYTTSDCTSTEAAGTYSNFSLDKRITINSSGVVTGIDNCSSTDLGTCGGGE